MAISAPPEPTIATASTRSLVGLTDCELVAEVRRGCDRAFEQLYERYHRRIAAYIFGMVNDYGRAEDIAQDVFMSALRRMRDTDREIAFKPWVYEIAKNACIDQFRRARRGEEVSYDAEEGLGAADYGRLVTTGPAPDVAVDQKMAIDHLRGAFGGLSRTHHEILVMRELEGLSYREIGERLGMSRPSVESTLFRARRRLGEEYEELVSGERCLRIQTIIGAAGAAIPGARDQRRLAAHLSHCQGCRRHARLSGLDAALLIAPVGARAKIAAFLPLPAFLRRRWVGEEVAPVATNHHVSQLAQLSAQVGTVDPVMFSWAKAVAAAATIAVAGVAGGAAAKEEFRGLPGAGSGAGTKRAAEAPAAAKPAGRAPSRVQLTPTPVPGRLGPASVPGSAPAKPSAAAPSATTLSSNSSPVPASPGASIGSGAVPASAPAGPEAPANPLEQLDPSRYPTSGGRTPSGEPQPDPVEAAVAETAKTAVEAGAGAETAQEALEQGSAATEGALAAAGAVTAADGGGLRK